MQPTRQQEDREAYLVTTTATTAAKASSTAGGTPSVALTVSATLPASAILIVDLKDLKEQCTCFGTGLLLYLPRAVAVPA